MRLIDYAVLVKKLGFLLRIWVWSISNFNNCSTSFNA